MNYRYWPSIVIGAACAAAIVSIIWPPTTGIPPRPAEVDAGTAADAVEGETAVVIGTNDGGIQYGTFVASADAWIRDEPFYFDDDSDDAGALFSWNGFRIGEARVTKVRKPPPFPLDICNYVARQVDGGASFIVLDDHCGITLYEPPAGWKP